LRALKLHGAGGTIKPGQPLPATLMGPNREALLRGFANLEKHIANVRTFGVPVVVAVNAFKDDPKDELEYVKTKVLESGAVSSAISTPWADGSAGAEALANAVVRACEQPLTYRPLYENSASIEQKIDTIARRIYGAEGVKFEPDAKTQIETATRLGYGRFPICMAKTQYSLSHDPLLLGRPTGFTLPVRELRILAGAEFLTAVCGGMQLMPGLPSRPAGEHVDVDPETGQIVGLS
jgi:formate--tetrahydrofolate ligase